VETKNNFWKQTREVKLSSCGNTKQLLFMEKVDRKSDSEKKMMKKRKGRARQKNCDNKK
jgi:hypothetical protein